MDSGKEAMIRRLEQESKGTFWDTLGCQFERLDGSAVIVSLDVSERHLNGIGILNGGVHASLLDNTMGLAAMLARPGEKVVTTNLNVHFLAPLGLGKVYVTAEIVHQTRRMITVQGRIEDSQGGLGSWGSGTFRVSPN